MRRFACVLAVAGWAGFLPVFAAGPPQPGFRLPDTAVPASYAVSLSIDPNRDTFDGSVTIQLEVHKPASVIWLNAKDIEPKAAKLANEPVRAHTISRELIQIDLPHQVSGPQQLSIDYRGRLDDKAVLGAYRRRVDGEWYVYTTFTPIEARRVIPCFDEPRFKTPWTISIKVPQGQRAFTNTPQTRVEAAPDGQQTFHFAESKPLPSELIAFAVGPFDVYEGQRIGGTPVRVITPKGQAAQGKAAAEAAVAVLPRLETYTGRPYPFGKLDYVALADGAFGAVENPGLITYLARELLILPGTETPARTRTLRLLEAHELGHQWFGDLVTQRDWDDTWLSEGFATWVSEKVMDQEEPPERAHFGMIQARERVMETDETRRSRPVRVEPVDRDGTRDIYNRFVYDKGAAVLLMLEGWLGDEKMEEGVRGYLQDNRFGNAATADLARELKYASGVDPTAVMHSFLDIGGLPRVSIQVECTPKPVLKIRQTGASAIPICYRGAGLARTCTILEVPARDIELPQRTNCPAWVVPNAGALGYYRTTWTAAQLASLPLQQFSEAERLQLAYDLRFQATDRAAARAVLGKLASDSQPEVQKAAEDAGIQPSGRASAR